MNKRFYILFTLLICCMTAFAQNSIVNDLNQTKPGQGDVRIYQDDAIKNLITSLDNKNKANQQSSSDSKNDKIKTYKIQVFSGNDQNRSKNEAYTKKNMINARFPQLHPRVKFDSPTWRLLVGNFDNEDDAKDALDQLKTAFPSFGREMYIVN